MNDQCPIAKFKLMRFQKYFSIQFYTCSFKLDNLKVSVIVVLKVLLKLILVDIFYHRSYQRWKRGCFLWYLCLAYWSAHVAFVNQQLTPKKAKMRSRSI